MRKQSVPQRVFYGIAIAMLVFATIPNTGTQTQAKPKVEKHEEVTEVTVQEKTDNILNQVDTKQSEITSKEEEIAAAEQAAAEAAAKAARSYSGGSGYSSDFKSAGVVYSNGTRYTWYSQRVLNGSGLDALNNNGRHVEDGFVKDGDGYIAVASNDHAQGTVVDTPYGQGKVYDSGCASGTIDIYTDY